MLGMNNNMLHNKPHELAGTTVIVNVDHPYIPKNSEFVVEDWWDRISEKPWMNCNGNPACLHYAMYSGSTHKPLDNEVVYGKIGGFGFILHDSDLYENFKNSS